ncbi:MAG: hypothetical protein Q9M27_04595 [Mariprofundaceae bacterium]|nr:hypothetical protein [Mariprofundaceae bacterium]
MMKIKRVRARLGNHLAPVFALVLLGGLSACSTTGGSGFLGFGSEEQPAAKPHVATSMSGTTIQKASTPLPHVGLYAFTHAHAMNPNPPDRWAAR